jgi:hypothetical protein
MILEKLRKIEKEDKKIDLAKELLDRLEFCKEILENDTCLMRLKMMDREYEKILKKENPLEIDNIYRLKEDARELVLPYKEKIKKLSKSDFIDTINLCIKNTKLKGINTENIMEFYMIIYSLCVFYDISETDLKDMR